MKTRSSHVILEAVSYDDPVAATMRERLTAELEERYREARGGRAHAGSRSRPTPEQFDPPDGVFLLAFAGTRSVGCGGLRRWGPGIGEIKRMYVDPGARGSGIGRAILEGLESAARDRGYLSIRLETGTPQPEAVALYESAGYARIEPYRWDWSHDLSVALEKHLRPGPAPGQIVLRDDARFDDPEAMELCRRLEHEDEQRYGPYDESGPQDHHHVPPTPAEFAPPAGRFVVARLDGRSVGCGGIRPYEGPIAEIKRMYVDPPARRRGIGRVILSRLEEAAGKLGYRAARLETGLMQPEAIALYESAGYERVAPYGEHLDDPMSACYERAL
ncbi:hypothetical protein BH20ACT24_BH20ACT24_21040 [soil metagenome]